MFPAEVVEHDGERAEGEEHVDPGLEDDDADAGERPPPPAPGRERLGHRGERADVLEVQRVHLPGRRRRRARRRRQLQLVHPREPQGRLLRPHHRRAAARIEGPRRRIRAMQSRPRAPSPRSEGTRERWVRADRSGWRGQMLGEEEEEEEERD